MKQNLDNYDFGLDDANREIKKTTDNAIKSAKVSSYESNAIKSNKCNQCNFTFSQAI